MKLLFVYLFLFLVSPLYADPVTFKDGANCLFIGHSFFVPVAKHFDKLARQHDFGSHQSSMVFAPGAGGAPGQLWKNPSRKKQIESRLATGKVHVLGMTSLGRAGKLQDYVNWIDLALKYNEKTQIFIGQPWMPGGPKMPTRQFATLTKTGGDKAYEIVVQLRKRYPGTSITFLNYGLVASIMKKSYEAGDLPDIKKISGMGKDTLFRDGMIGHAGSMMLELCALSWLDALYGAPISDLAYSDYQADVKAILMRVQEENRKYR